jgi:predicted nucleic-acid-binding Zn-ribbon protein
MKKIIDVVQVNIIECDNPNCGYHIPSETGDFNEDISKYLNKRCPKCGENLLTEHDYMLSMKNKKIINRINFWFSWLTIFRPLMFWAKPKTFELTQHQKTIIKEIETPD